MRLFALTLVLAFAASTQAQTQIPPAAASSTHADWSRVQALKPGTKVLLDASTRHGSCTILVVTADDLTCSSGIQPHVLRANIRAIKLPHRGRSVLIGAAAGGAAGAIAGYAAAGPNSSNFNIVSRSDAAVIFAVPLAIIGALIGFFTDFARTTFYRAN